MATPNDYFVDPGGSADSGDGTVGTPWTPRTGPTKSAIQHALDTITRDATNGDKIHIKAGTADVQTAALGFGTYGTPGGGSGLWLQGYTSVAEDGGVGEIDLNGGNYSLAAATTYVQYVDLNVHNNVSATLISCGTGCNVYRCELHNSTGIAIALSSGWAIGNNIHDCSNTGILLGAGNCTAFGNYLKNGTKGFTVAIITAQGNMVSGNIISLDGSSIGIQFAAHWTIVYNNSILSAAGTGKGIDIAGDYASGASFNLIEGFSGAGGVGLNLSGQTGFDSSSTNNAIYNCTTEITAPNGYNLGFDNESLGASPFAKSGADTFANRATYFAAVSTGNVQTGGLHGQHKGAIAAAAAAASGAPFFIRSSNSLLTR